MPSGVLQRARLDSSTALIGVRLHRYGEQVWSRKDETAEPGAQPHERNSPENQMDILTFRSLPKNEM